MLDSQLQGYCEENFQDAKNILSNIFEYKKMLLRENDNMNLIGKSTIENFDQRHLLDCLQISKYLPARDKIIADIGTGAGLPGILLAIIGYKNIHLIEKSPKKSAFLKLCNAHLGLSMSIHNKSIVDVSNLKVDCITARAFAPIEKITSLTKNIIHKNTNFILLKGKSYLSELNLINPDKYLWQNHPSITSDEYKIIVMSSK